MTYPRLVRPVLFRRDAEAAHEWTLRRLAALSRRPAALAPLRQLYARSAPRTVFGVRFPNPVGLAAGLDKDGRALPAWPALGFGFIEVGTVTRHAQPGNPPPRLFRLPASGALINRMGFNNAGAAAPRGLRRGQRQLPEHSGPARVAGPRSAGGAAGRPACRGRPDAGTGEGGARPDRPRARRAAGGVRLPRRGGGDRHEHDPVARRPRPRRRPARRPSGRAVRPAARAAGPRGGHLRQQAQRAAGDRRRWHPHAGGRVAALRRRGEPGAALHRAGLRRAGPGTEDRPWTPVSAALPVRPRCRPAMSCWRSTGRTCGTRTRRCPGYGTPTWWSRRRGCGCASPTGACSSTG